MTGIILEYSVGTGPLMPGPTKIKGEPGDWSPVVDINLNGTLNGTPTLQVDGGPNPLAARISTPAGEAVVADLTATLNGGLPLTAVIEGGKPLNVALGATLAATVTAPVAVDFTLRDIGLRPAKIKFKLCGLFTILTMEVGP